MQNTGMQGSSPSGSTAERLADQASAGLSRLSDTAQQTMGRVSDFAAQTAERWGEKGNELMQSRAVEQARSYVREHPVAAIGIAIAVGLLISKLTSRR
jgi:ElaB/YqjD/DUF883 family membrane-anchored ribosome-binding protein